MPQVKKSPWSAEEDGQLANMVHVHGPKRWATIAISLPGRTGKQCRERWLNHLDPSVSKEVFSKEEDLLIISLVDTLGTKWAQISKHLPGRTDNAVKNRYYSTLRRVHSKGSDQPPTRAKKKGCKSGPPPPSAHKGFDAAGNPVIATLEKAKPTVVQPGYPYHFPAPGRGTWNDLAGGPQSSDHHEIIRDDLSKTDDKNNFLPTLPPSPTSLLMSDVDMTQAYGHFGLPRDRRPSICSTATDDAGVGATDAITPVDLGHAMDLGPNHMSDIAHQSASSDQLRKLSLSLSDGIADTLRLADISKVSSLPTGTANANPATHSPHGYTGRKSSVHAPGHFEPVSVPPEHTTNPISSTWSKDSPLPQKPVRAQPISGPRTRVVKQEPSVDVAAFRDSLAKQGSNGTFLDHKHGKHDTKSKKSKNIRGRSKVKGRPTLIRRDSVNNIKKEDLMEDGALPYNRPTLDLVFPPGTSEPPPPWETLVRGTSSPSTDSQDGTSSGQSGDDNSSDGTTSKRMTVVSDRNDVVHFPFPDAYDTQMTQAGDNMLYGSDTPLPPLQLCVEYGLIWNLISKPDNATTTSDRMI